MSTMTTAERLLRDGESLEALVRGLPLADAHRAAAIAGGAVGFDRAALDAFGGRDERPAAGRPMVAYYAGRALAAREGATAAALAYAALAAAQRELLARPGPGQNLAWPHPCSAERQLRQALADALQEAAR